MRLWGGLLVLTACGRLEFDPVEEATDYCTRIPALAAAPIIDGVPEPLTLEPVVPVGWLSSEMPASPIPDVTARYAIGWRPEGLYFFVDVSDPDRFPATSLSYCGDGVELYVDSDGSYPDAPQFESTGVRQYIARAPQDATTSRADGDVWLSLLMIDVWASGFRTFPRAGGYALEAVIDSASLGIPWTLASGDRVGVDLAINVSRSDGAPIPIVECMPNLRLGQYFLRVDDSYPDPSEGAPYYVPTAFCTATLEP